MVFSAALMHEDGPFTFSKRLRVSDLEHHDLDHAYRGSFWDAYSSSHLDVERSSIGGYHLNCSFFHVASM